MRVRFTCVARAVRLCVCLLKVRLCAFVSEYNGYLINLCRVAFVNENYATPPTS